MISNNPTESATYQMILGKIATYFDIERRNIGTRFNWYRDSSDWKVGREGGRGVCLYPLLDMSVSMRAVRVFVSVPTP